MQPPTVPSELSRVPETQMVLRERMNERFQGTKSRTQSLCLGNFNPVLTSCWESETVTQSLGPCEAGEMGSILLLFLFLLKKKSQCKMVWSWKWNSYPDTQCSPSPQQPHTSTTFLNFKKSVVSIVFLVQHKQIKSFSSGGSYRKL